MKAVKGAREVEGTLGIKFAERVQGTLSKLQDVLILSDDEDFNYDISAATVDFCCSTAFLALEDTIAGTKTPTKAWDIIKIYQKELYLKDSTMKEMMTRKVIQALGRLLERVDGFARVNNAAVTRDGLIDADDGMMLDPRVRVSD